MSIHQHPNTSALQHILTAVLSLVLLTFSNQCFAQISKEDFDIAQALISKTKREFVKQYMGTRNNPDSAAFWKLYDDYEAHRKVVVADRFNLLREYAEKYKTLDDATASHLAEGFMASTVKMDELNKRYFNKFKKLIGGLQAATLFQIEYYVQTATQANIHTQIPIIGELQKLSLKQHGISDF